ncbi:uncharacterized protein LOC144093147 [Stigmatopora argus]
MTGGRLILGEPRNGTPAEPVRPRTHSARWIRPYDGSSGGKAAPMDSVASMAPRPVRPASEIRQSARCSVGPSVSYSSLTGAECSADDGEALTPIFSISKSSVDVFDRDLAWSGVDLRRSSSADQGGPRSPDPRRPSALSDRWLANTRRWSRSSAGAQSRSSTPDTVVWGGETSRPGGPLPERARYAVPASPDAAVSSPFVSPLLTPTSADLRSSSTGCSPPSPASLARREDDLASDLPPEAFFRVKNSEDNSFMGGRLLYFQYPSPVASSVCSEEGAFLADGQTSPMPVPPAGESTVCRLQLPWQPRPRRLNLVSSLSDSLLGEGCRCSKGNLEIPPFLKAQREMADAAVQTSSPAVSWLHFRRNTSQSLLGSPPGSKLDLKASEGSNSNLVSPSSSMFPASDEEEEEKPKDLQERRRSCLKAQVGEEKREPGGRRRSSMKQVQWDEDGMTWDVHGASVEPQVLSRAIRKHLESRDDSPIVRRPSGKKTRAPQPPAGVAPDQTSPDDGERETAAAATCRVKMAVEGEEILKSPSLSRGSVRKRGVIKALKPGWCGGSKNQDD